jgi:hypothetical protein
MELPESDLGGAPGTGAILRVTQDLTALDDTIARGESHLERAKQLETLARVEGTLYVAASPDTNVRTLRTYLSYVPKGVTLKLLYRTPSELQSPQGTGPASGLATQLLTERDRDKRRALALDGYDTYSKCAGVKQAAVASQELEDGPRWAKLRGNLLEALPACSCDQLDSTSLKQLLVAEQRAGSMQLGAMPLSFLADERCGASMPLRSVQKLLGQVERFDEDYAGAWKDDALSFEKVITNERLLGYFCDALPGETLAALQRQKATIYLKLASGCQGWRFDPLSAGTPMGTWHRESQGSEKRSIFYWQAAEHIRVFGPAEDKKKPTDSGPWACEKTLELTGIDASSVSLESARWFFSVAECKEASADAITPNGCFAAPEVPAEPAAEGSEAP